MARIDETSPDPRIKRLIDRFLAETHGDLLPNVRRDGERLAVDLTELMRERLLDLEGEAVHWRARADILQKQVRNMEDDAASWRAVVDRFQNRNDDLQERNERLNEQVDVQQKRIDDLEKELLTELLTAWWERATSSKAATSREQWTLQLMSNPGGMQWGWRLIDGDGKNRVIGPLVHKDSFSAHEEATYILHLAQNGTFDDLEPDVIEPEPPLSPLTTGA